jgi:hypothetical protein
MKGMSAVGTFRTCHDFRVESAFGSKAEVGVSSPPRAASGAKRPDRSMFAPGGRTDTLQRSAESPFDPERRSAGNYRTGIDWRVHRFPRHQYSPAVTSPVSGNNAVRDQAGVASPPPGPRFHDMRQIVIARWSCHAPSFLDRNSSLSFQRSDVGPRRIAVCRKRNPRHA